jgi:hypothetical protein
MLPEYALSRAAACRLYSRLAPAIFTVALSFALSPLRGQEPARPEVAVTGEQAPLPEAGETEKPLPPVIPPLDFFAAKEPMPDLLLKNKREGFYMTGFPALGSDPDKGFVFGAALQLFDNGPKDTPFFRYTPYRKRLLIGATAATKGYSRFVVGYDNIFLADSPYRLTAGLSLIQNDFENYFGAGEQSLERLHFPGSTKSFKKYDDYLDAIDDKQSGLTWERYSVYKRRESLAGVTIERVFLGGRLKPQFGMHFSLIGVDDYTGDKIHGAIQQETWLKMDDRLGLIDGFDGGWDNSFRVGLAFDTRDFEPDPSEGVFLQAMSRISPKFLGSEFDYTQVTLTARGYHSVFPELAHLVLAGRVLYSMQFGDVPFYSLPKLALTDGDTTGLGGWPTIRGYNLNRFIGEAAALANAEVRWKFAETDFVGQHLSFTLAPFFDTGRVFDGVRRTTFEDWKWGTGAGLKLGWNLSTIISFDVGYSPEATYFSMEVGMQF